MKKSFLTKLIVFGFVAGLLTALALLAREMSQVGIQQGYEPDQPIPYSHKIHAGENKIPCLYCHYGAEQGRHAGIPPAELCLNCHKQIKKDSPEILKINKAIETGKPIEWVKVHNLPDFVYFNHAQHVAVGKVECTSCHGPVDTMGKMRQENPLTMGWCISCHRERGITPPEGHDQFKENLLLNKEVKTSIGGLDCAKCHY